VGSRHGPPDLIRPTVQINSRRYVVATQSRTSKFRSHGHSHRSSHHALRLLRATSRFRARCPRRLQYGRPEKAPTITATNATSFLSGCPSGELDTTVANRPSPVCAPATTIEKRDCPALSPKQTRDTTPARFCSTDTTHRVIQPAVCSNSTGPSPSNPGVS